MSLFVYKIQWNFSPLFPNGPQRKNCPIFKKGDNCKTSVLQEKQDDDSALYVTDALRNRISPSYLGCSGGCSCHRFTYRTGQLIDLLHITQIIWERQLAPFYKTGETLKQEDDSCTNTLNVSGTGGKRKWKFYLLCLGLKK